jgi:hypothetical protein
MLFIELRVEVVLRRACVQMSKFVTSQAYRSPSTQISVS